MTEGQITNERLRYVLRIHKSDITTLLQHLCRQGFISSEGYGRGTKYKLSDKAITSTNTNVDSLEPNVDSLEPNVDSLEPNVDSLEPNVDSLEKNMESIRDNCMRNSIVKNLLKKKRLSSTDMETVLTEVASEWRSIRELTDILGKDKSYLRNRILPSLISKGVLEREYPSIPNHPNQRYKAKKI
ncbi:MAG: hypothetical protein K2K84_01535 [Muribaculaceae bacterium]|nr:hypothetical protein [Muribaculaceae bacterium]